MLLLFCLWCLCWKLVCPAVQWNSKLGWVNSRSDQHGTLQLNNPLSLLDVPPVVSSYVMFSLFLVKIPIVACCTHFFGLKLTPKNNSSSLNIWLFNQAWMISRYLKSLFFVANVADNVTMFDYVRRYGHPNSQLWSLVFLCFFFRPVSFPRGFILRWGSKTFKKPYDCYCYL